MFLLFRAIISNICLRFNIVGYEKLVIIGYEVSIEYNDKLKHVNSLELYSSTFFILASPSQ